MHKNTKTTHHGNWTNAKVTVAGVTAIIHGVQIPFQTFSFHAVGYNGPSVYECDAVNLFPSTWSKLTLRIAVSVSRIQLRGGDKHCEPIYKAWGISVFEFSMIPTSAACRPENLHRQTILVIFRQHFHLHALPISVVLRSSCPLCRKFIVP